jgi:hypothetical protein
VIWLVLAVAGVAATAVLGAASLRLDSVVPFALGVYLLASAEVIGLTEVLSLLGWIRPAGYAVGQALCFAAAAGAWWWRGRPRPPLRRYDLRAAVNAHPLVAGLAVGIAALVVYEAFLVFATPPNNWDSMTYHLSRAAGWYQRHRVEYFPAHTERENAFQPNSELEILYTFVLVGRDTAAAATQLIAQLALLIGVYGCARRLGLTRPASLFAALLTATLSEIALQSVTTQNDLLAASFVVAAVCLVLGTATADLVLAGLAVGLALGTKLTAAPALLILAALAVLRAPWRQRAVTLAVSSAVALALVGFYGYGLNLIETGKPLGRPVAQGETHVDRVTVGGTVSTAARSAFRFFDFSGLNPPDWETSAVSWTGRKVFAGLHIPANPPEATQSGFNFRVNVRANEDVAWFGPLGFLLLLPLSLVFLIRGAARRAPPEAFVLAAAIPLFAVVLALGFKYNVWLGRFFVAPVALTMPLAAYAYRRSTALALSLALVGLFGLYKTVTMSETKPAGVDERAAVWTLPRSSAQTIVRPDLTAVFDGVNDRVPSKSTLGAVLGPDDWDYPLYGPTLERRIVPLPRFRPLAAAERRNIHWVLLNWDAPRPAPRRGWRRRDIPDSAYSLYSD